MNRAYRVLFLGLSGKEKDFRFQMSRLGASPESLDLMISKAPVILKEGLDLSYSRRYADAVQAAGGIAEIQGYEPVEGPVNHSLVIAPFEDFTRCPECGLKQQKKDTCVRCGFRLSRTENGLEPRNVAGH